MTPIVPTPIVLVELEDDGLAMKPGVKEVVVLMNEAGDGSGVEAGYLIGVWIPGEYRERDGMEVKADGEWIYVLLFSRDCFTTERYDVSYAMARNISGPYTRAEVP